MAQRAFALPIRVLLKSSKIPAQWICNRCLATQATALKATSSPSQYPLEQRRIDDTLSKPLAHSIPPQYLLYSSSDALSPEEKVQREMIPTPKKPKIGVVVSSGRMHKTVKVRLPGRQWNNKIGKYFSRPTNHLVHDPNNSLITGDVVELHRLRVSTIVHYVVASIVTPFGTPISERPPIPTPDERLAKYKERRFAKMHRRELRQRAADGDASAIQELKSMGLDAGKNAEPGKRKTEGLEKGAGQVRTPKKGAILGNKGRKLPEGVLPDGKHEVGKINERAQKNKGEAMRMEAQAEKNLLEAKEVEDDLRTEEELGARTIVPKQRPNLVVEERPQAGNSRSA